VSDLKQRITDLADLMEEFRLAEAEIESDGQRIAFRRRSQIAVTSAVHSVEAAEQPEAADIAPEAEPVSNQPKGVPVTSPMTGIFYAAPSPNAPAFVKEGEQVTAGQVVGLIEAMKVFNEITASTSGTVTKLVAESGQLVQPGDPLLYIG
jgi:acetyl-CoA carboxylase biotin carboxyl carrier protein